MCLWVRIKSQTGLGNTVSGSISIESNSTFNDDVYDKNKWFTYQQEKPLSLRGIREYHFYFLDIEYIRKHVKNKVYQKVKNVYKCIE